MPKLSRHLLACLTTVALVSFTSAAHSQNSAAAAPTPFRENPAWTLSDGVLTSNASGMESALVSRAGLADSMASFEFRASKGAKATVFVGGRYGFDLEGNGSRTRSRSKSGSEQKFVATSFSKSKAPMRAGITKTRVGRHSSS
jgi:hypothetical protein